MKYNDDDRFINVDILQELLWNSRFITYRTRGRCDGVNRQRSKPFTDWTVVCFFVIFTKLNEQPKQTHNVFVVNTSYSIAKHNKIYVNDKEHSQSIYTNVNK